MGWTSRQSVTNFHHKGTDFFLHFVYTHAWVHQAFHATGTGGFISECKASHEADHSLPSGTMNKNMGAVLPLPPPPQDLMTWCLVSQGQLSLLLPYLHPKPAQYDATWCKINRYVQWIFIEALKNLLTLNENLWSFKQTLRNGDRFFLL
jgi:hypothetical protein